MSVYGITRLTLKVIPHYPKRTCNLPLPRADAAATKWGPRLEPVQRSHEAGRMERDDRGGAASRYATIRATTSVVYGKDHSRPANMTATLGGS
jgi:hypothetical protein